MQQSLPFTVLKRSAKLYSAFISTVATVLTVYGIETGTKGEPFKYTDFVATVLTVYGIETQYATI